MDQLLIMVEFIGKMPFGHFHIFFNIMWKKKKEILIGGDKYTEFSSLLFSEPLIQIEQIKFK